MNPYHLELCYDYGYGVHNNLEAAVLSYLRAADHGLACAMWDLSLSFSKGTGVPLNPEQAMGWCERAALKGCVPALYHLGAHYMCGDGDRIPMNEAKGYEYLRKASELGDAKSCLRLAQMYFAQNPSSVAEADAVDADAAITVAETNTTSSAAMDTDATSSAIKVAEADAKSKTTSTSTVAKPKTTTSSADAKPTSGAESSVVSDTLSHATYEGLRRAILDINPHDLNALGSHFSGVFLNMCLRILGKTKAEVEMLDWNGWVDDNS